ncbi:MAG: penicillin-binding protein 2 [Actinomycetota bacterium]|nr:penicillin-binding protein 2 [Actinomycetota bacterium]
MPPRRHSRSPGRLIALFLLLALTYVAMAGRLVVLQIVEGPAYARLAADQRQRVIEFAARRGAILDRDGQALAVSVDMKTVYADPYFVENPRRTAVKLAPALGEPGDAGELAANLTEKARYVYLARQVPAEVADRVEALDLPGIYTETEPKRFYPGGNVASHVIGFVDVDGKGLAGVELQYQQVLEGRPGRMTIEQDPQGRPLPQADSSYQEPRQGRELFLTIDKELQYFTEHALAEAATTYHAGGASAVVMRPSSGEILAMANVPDFDPNDAGAYAESAHRNRAVTDLYEPGSAFKAITVSAALDAGVVTPRRKFVVPASWPYAGEVFNDSHVHPTEPMRVTDIITESSNVGTIKIGLEFDNGVFRRYVRDFGFGSPTGLDFPAEQPGMVPDLEGWTGATEATVPIGQGIAATPMQMASAYSTIANDGVWVEPKLLLSTVDSAGRTSSSPPASRRVISEDATGKVAKMLTRVVDEGTGVAAQIQGYEVAGKTGTAQKPLPTGGYGNSYVGSFAGFAPARDPQIAVVVVLDEPTPIWGGLTAAPTFRTITEFALSHLRVPPTRSADGTTAAAPDPSIRD